MKTDKSCVFTQIRRKHSFSLFFDKKTQNILKSLLFILHVYNPLNVPSKNIADLIHTLIDICIHSVPQKSPGIIIHGCG